MFVPPLKKRSIVSKCSKNFTTLHFTTYLGNFKTNIQTFPSEFYVRRKKEEEMRRKNFLAQMKMTARKNSRFQHVLNLMHVSKNRSPIFEYDYRLIG